MADENSKEVGLSSTVEIEVIPPPDEQNEGDTTDSSNNA
jgi:hypothetical protein